MACPYFFPTEKSGDIVWPFPQRLPLGSGYRGLCTAGGARSVPTEAELKEFCNLGYARRCEKMPSSRPSDAVRFSLAENGGEREVVVHFSIERDHAPVEHGQLRYDGGTRAWRVSHQDACVQRQAECYLAARLERK